MGRRAPWIALALLALIGIALLWQGQAGRESTPTPRRDGVQSGPVEPTPPALAPNPVAPTPETLPAIPEPDARPTPPDAAFAVVTVRDDAGAAVADVGIVEALNVPPGSPGPYERLLGRTDGEGVLRLPIPDRRMWLRVESGGEWHSDDRRTLPDDRERLQFRVVGWRTIRGVVRDATGSPLAGVGVQVNYQARSERGSTRFAFHTFGPTDVAGRFEGKVPAYVGDVELRAHASGGSAQLKVGADAPNEVVLQVGRENWIRGQIVDSEGKAPEDGWLQALPPTGETNSGATFDGSGPSFQLLVPSAGRYVLVFSDPDGRLASPDPLPVEAPAEGVRLACPPGQRLAGRLQGNDVARFHVVWTQRRGADPRLAARKRTMTDAEGRFRLDGVRPGDSTLYVDRPGDPRYAIVRNPQTPDETMVVSLKDGAAVRGRVVGYAGHRGFELWIHVVWDGPTRGVPVADDGTFSIPGLPAGTYGLQWEEGERRGTFDVRAEAGGAPVELPRP